MFRPIPTLVWWVRLLLSSPSSTPIISDDVANVSAQSDSNSPVFLLFKDCFLSCRHLLAALSLPPVQSPSYNCFHRRSLSPESNSRLAVGVWNITLTLDERGGGGGSLKKNTHVVRRPPRQSPIPTSLETPARSVSVLHSQCFSQPERKELKKILAVSPATCYRA